MEFGRLTLRVPGSQRHIPTPKFLKYPHGGSYNEVQWGKPCNFPETCGEVGGGSLVCGRESKSEDFGLVSGLFRHLQLDVVWYCYRHTLTKNVLKASPQQARKIEALVAGFPGVIPIKITGVHVGKF